jgi:hypothetical protein
MHDELEKNMFMGWRRPQHSLTGIKPDGTKRTVNVQIKYNNNGQSQYFKTNTKLA